MKVLHGMSEVAGQGIYAVLGLQANGINANMAVWRRNPMNYPVDIDLKIDRKNKMRMPFYALKMGGFALKAMLKYDVVHSHFGYSLLPFGIDLPFLSRLNKKLFVEFHGSDIRFIFKDIKYKYYRVGPPEDSIRTKMQTRIRKLLAHADGVILHDAELLQHLPDIDIPVYIVPLRVDICKFDPVYPDMHKNKPIIVHAPSRRSTKGTEEILEALKRVSGDYELILVEGKTQEEAIQIYKNADIIIDQVAIGTYGVFAIEAMALGKPVITYISDEMRKTLPEDLPIVSADFDTLPQVIDSLLNNGEKRNVLGKEGRRYVERYHDNKKVAAYLAQIYEENIDETDIFKLL
ncbi:MAG: glycosyltransferase family 4 protein [Bacillota bacterium]|nr:glycosyltransferase family 4 protein [Bacillota bacterium]